MTLRGTAFVGALALVLVIHPWALGAADAGHEPWATHPPFTGAQVNASAPPSPARSTPAEQSGGVGDAVGEPVASPIRRPVSSAGRSLPSCQFDERLAPRHGLDDWARTLVDTSQRLPASYAPSDLVPLEQAGLSGGRIRSFVVPDLRAMVEAATAEGVVFAVQSGYRSFDRQAVVYQGWVQDVGEAQARLASARPGHSEHQLGTALDLRADGGSAPWSIDFAATTAGHWLADHAWQFGFVLSYPPGMRDLTCYQAEPWHVRYVGRHEAADIHASGLTLREWLWLHGG